MLFDLGLQNLGLLVLRLVVAAVFLYHGSRKLMGWKKTPGFFRFLGICETLGGISMFFGLLTELSALGFTLLMLGALYHKLFKWKTPFSAEKSTGWEFDLTLLAMALALFFLGAGTLSLDALLGI